MIKSMKFLFIALIVSSCAEQKPKDQFTHLEGYWEISRVEINPDSVREYKYNETIDFIDLDGATGTKSKVKPQLDGTYQVTGVTEDIEMVMDDKELYIKYTTPYDTFRERVVHAEENDLKLENEEGVIYFYKRYKPLFSEDEDNEKK